MEQRGLYRELLDICWERGSLPADDETVRRLAACEKAEWRRCWPVLIAIFPVGEDGYRHHEKVDQRRPELIRWHEQKRAAGQKSGQSRRTDVQRAFERAVNGRSTGVAPPFERETNHPHPTSASPQERASDSARVETGEARAGLSLAASKIAKTITGLTGKPIKAHDKIIESMLATGVHPALVISWVKSKAHEKRIETNGFFAHAIEELASFSGNYMTRTTAAGFTEDQVISGLDAELENL